MRTRLGALGGKRYWRSLQELSQTQEFEDFLEREFPANASEWRDPVSRRGFLKLMGASMALAGITGCGRQPEEKIIPYVVPPEQVVQGKPLYFATAVPFQGYGKGVVVESHMGRPTKVEGNPDHPASLGATDIWMQASVLEVWDPDRAQTVTRGGQVAAWSEFLRDWEKGLAQNKDGVRILTEYVTSPTLIAQIQQFTKKHNAKWHYWEPVNRDNIRQGTEMAFGKRVEAVYHFDKAKRILSLDGNFLLEEPGSVLYARHFGDGRRVRWPEKGKGAESVEMSRLYVVESTPTITGAMADHVQRVKHSQVEGMARAIAAKLGVAGATSEITDAGLVHFVQVLAKDLQEHKGASLVVAGAHQPAVVHALAHAMNDVLGNTGKTVTFKEAADAHEQSALDSLTQLVRDMNAGQVHTLIILGGNPAYTAPADLDFAGALSKVNKRVHHSIYFDETSFYCHWHLPATHYLESWSDVRAFDGTASVIQPLIAPLYEGRTAHQVIGMCTDGVDPGLLPPVQEYWRKTRSGNDFDAWWVNALGKGVLDGQGTKDAQVTLAGDFLSKAGPKAAAPAGAVEIMIRPDPCIWDGRFANNGWLQELPKPLTKITWDNAALMNPADIEANHLEGEGGDGTTVPVIEVKANGQTLYLPVWPMPGHPRGSISVYLGYGRTRSGRIGTATQDVGGLKGNAYLIRKSDSLWNVGGSFASTSGMYRLACTQSHQLMKDPEGIQPAIKSEEEGGKEVTLTYELMQVKSLEKFREEVAKGPPKKEKRFNLLQDWEHYDRPSHQWAMQIDNNTCIACNSCVVACQAENNIPIVGKDQVLNHREMHWIRIDTYYEGEAAFPEGTYFEPIPCMHCEKAPCEIVCPVGATTHSAEGLNEMTYNRCVGTRYCSNNCPYKVRRFNFLQYSDVVTPSRQLGYNPDVTVRERGVMEKCTYCVQRLNLTRIEVKRLWVEYDEAAGKRKTDIRAKIDALMGGLQTACQQACPTEAIIFGDRNWQFADGRRTEVALLQAEQLQPQGYALLPELNTMPRTRYLPRLTNPNPELATAGAHA